MYCIYLSLPRLGAKYKFAQQWQIYCVSPQWLYDSAERGYCQSEEPYSVDESATGAGGREGGRQKTDKGIRNTRSTQVQWNLSNLDICIHCTYHWQAERALLVVSTGRFFYIFIYVCDKHCSYRNTIRASNFACTLFARQQCVAFN